MYVCCLSDESVKYQTLPAVHLRHVTSPTSITTTVGHEVDIEGWRLFIIYLSPFSLLRAKFHGSSFLVIVASLQ